MLSASTRSRVPLGIAASACHSPRSSSAEYTVLGLGGGTGRLGSVVRPSPCCPGPNGELAILWPGRSKDVDAAVWINCVGHLSVSSRVLQVIISVQYAVWDASITYLLYSSHALVSLLQLYCCC